MRRRLSRSGLALALVGGLSLLAACSTTPVAAPAPAPVASAAPAAAPAPQANTHAVDEAALQAQAEAARQQQLMAHLNQQSVFFDFDDFTVKPGNEDLLSQEAKLLQAQPSDHLVLQGNSDERGGIEYNLALGQKRADAVRKALVLLGAPAARIETVSFGEEKPRATCHDESCWSQNRRVDFVNALH
jgi:peptidoglycan-associated lipoprotein